MAIFQEHTVWMKIGRKSIINGSVSHNFPTLIGSALNDDYTQIQQKITSKGKEIMISLIINNPTLCNRLKLD
jgi:hypothetical protein